MDKILLLVDDEENVLRSLQRLFRREPYTVLTANSGTQALTVLEQHPVSVILSDQRMPGMTGAEFFKTVKALYPDTLRLIMSGYTELESVTSAINDGAIFKFLLKPWDDDKLLGHIREAFSLYELKASHQQLLDELAALNQSLEARVQAEHEKLRLNMRSLALSQEVLERLPIAVFGLSDNELLVQANARARDLLQREDLVGYSMEDVIPAALCSELRALVKNSMQTRECAINWGQGLQSVQISHFQEAGQSMYIVAVCGCVDKSFTDSSI